MSVNGGEEDLELQALQRQLDDAFETTRPRPGFDDELWLRMQGIRPAPRRLRDAFAGLFNGIRAVPAVPLTAVAAILVVVIFVAALTRIGSFGPGGGGASTGANSAQAPADRSLYAGSFGRLPTPAFAAPGLPSGSLPSSNQGSAAAAAPRYTWTGTFTLNIATAPVFRYHEPSTNAADQFATALGAVLHERPSGFLGSYTAADYSLKVRGTVQSPPSSPAYFIFSSNAMPAVDAAGAGPIDQANVFLAQHSLTPQWSYTVEADTSSDPVQVHYDRQFDVPGYGPAYLVRSDGAHDGLQVSLSANRPVLASGLLPMSLDVADYRLVSADEAIRAAVAATGPAAGGPSPVPPVNLSQAEVVYVLVPAGDHSFYEPAIFFTGTSTQNGQTQTRHVLVPAVDPSQRTP